VAYAHSCYVNKERYGSVTKITSLKDVNIFLKNIRPARLLLEPDTINHNLKRYDNPEQYTRMKNK